MAEAQLEAPALKIYYLKLNQPQVDARLGKMKTGDVVAVDEDVATRFVAAGIADQVGKGEYDQTRNRRQEKLSARQNAMRALNDAAAVWDVSTYRDVLTAPEQGLRLAAERGIPLVNVHLLRDADGDPLPPDADIDEILEARQYLHADLQAPLAAHDRSSVMGGGSPYSQVVGGGPMPLNPAHRAMAESIARQDAMAQAMPQSLRTDAGRAEPQAPAARSQAAARRQASMHSPQRASTESPGPGRAEVSPEAEAAQRAANVDKPATGELLQSNKD